MKDFCMGCLRDYDFTQKPMAHCLECKHSFCWQCGHIHRGKEHEDGTLAMMVFVTDPQWVKLDTEKLCVGKCKEF